MTIKERYKHLRKIKLRYLPARRKKRSRLLDEMEAVTGRHRKSLIRLMGKPGPAPKRRCKQRGRKYEAKASPGGLRQAFGPSLRTKPQAEGSVESLSPKG